MARSAESAKDTIYGEDCRRLNSKEKRTEYTFNRSKLRSADSIKNVNQKNKKRTKDTLEEIKVT